MPVKLENVQITSYQLGVLDNNASTKDVDGFVFQTQALPGDGDVDGRDFLMWQKSDGASGHTGGANFVFCDGSVRTLDGQDDPNLLLPAVSDPNLLLPAVSDPNLLLPYTDFDIA